MRIIYFVSMVKLTTRCQGLVYLLWTKLHKIWEKHELTKKPVYSTLVYF